MITPQRLEQEKMLLKARQVPENTYRFMDVNTILPYVIFAARTNRGNVYTIRIDLDEFPNKVPCAFVTKMLRDRNGHKLAHPSAVMHVLESQYGYTRICHYGFDSWTPNVSLFKVYVKCRLWLEMYELHLETGNGISYYLNEQE